MTDCQAGLDNTSNSNIETEAENLRLLDRTPHPYRLSSYDKTLPTFNSSVHATPSGPGQRRKTTKSKKVNSAAGSSESGTEADDETERQSFVKALPPPNFKPRKGLKIGERDEETLLTPSQLDEDGRPLEGHTLQKESLTDTEEKKLLLKRRINEFARRCSEVGLMVVISILVLCGHGVLSTARQWSFEVLLHILIVAGLIMAYPIRLSLLDKRTTITKPWQRFRVPVSFDPATVLYPPILPVLVALSLSSINPALILPNIILGLSTLPQRLFPRSSRLGGFNSLHWLVAIIPLAFGSHFRWMQSLSSVDSLGMSVETLVSLYPLHHSLLMPLHYLTTSSLLISELHLLSTALINLLLFARAPQAAILKACLWIGGVSLFALNVRVLHWNVTLARVPRWKLRHPEHPDAERKSLIDAVAEVINMQRATKAFQGLAGGYDSDADEDHDLHVSIKRQAKHNVTRQPLRFDKSHANGSPHSRAQALIDKEHTVVVSADDNSLETRRGGHKQNRGRRATLPTTSIKPEVVISDGKKRAKKRSSHIPWCLRLTSKQAYLRKLLYATWTYATIVLIILGPVRYYVGKRALFDREPIGWALSYLLGQLGPFQHITDTLGLNFWIPKPPVAAGYDFIYVMFLVPFDVPSIRHALGMSNLRLLAIVYWLLVLSTGLLAVFTLTPYVEVDTRRKIFHGVMVGMFMPAMFIDPCFCSLAVSLVLAIFLLLEVIRAAQIPPLGTAIGRFIAPYVDGRDLRGPVVVSHLFLLIGCAVPLWFSLAGLGRQDDGIVWRDWETSDQARDVGMLAGVICVGMGDAAASLIGRRYGRRKWPWVGGKSLEGSAAFALAVTLGLALAKVWLHIGAWQDVVPVQHTLQSGSLWMLKAWFCACGASFMEAVLTGANDNVVVPVALWLLVKGTRL